MASTPEKKVKAQLKKILDGMEIYYFFPPANGYGRSGIPDVVCCHKGRFIAFECKAGKGKTTALQQRELQRIEANGGTAMVVDEGNVYAIGGYLELLGDGL